MSNPITWRNVQGPSLADAARPLALAEQSFGRAFDSLGGIIKGAEDTQAANVVAQKTANTQSFLNELAKFRTPEALEAARTDGSLDQIRAGYGNNIDQNIARSALDGRLDTLYKQTKTAAEYKDYALDREQAPVRDQVLAFAAQGNAAGAKAILEANPKLRNAAEMYKAVVSGERDLTKFTREGEKFALDQKLGEVKIKGAESDLLTDVARRGLIGVQASNASLEGQERRRVLSDRASADAVTKRLADLAMGHIASGAKNDTEAMTKAVETLRKEGVPAEQLFKAQGTAAQLFDSRNFNTPVGRDAAEIDAKKASDAAKEAWYKENGIAAPGSTEGMRNIESLTKFVSTAVPDKKDQEDLNKFVAKMSRIQIELDNGNKVGIPEQIIKQAILESKDTAWVFGNERGKDAERKVRELMKDDRVQDDIAARTQLDVAAVRRKFQEALNPSKKK